MPRAPKNSCAKCRYTWYPRGHTSSSRCPHCGSRSVEVLDSPEPSLLAGCGGLLGVLFAVLMLIMFVRCAGDQSTDRDRAQRKTTPRSISDLSKSPFREGDWEISLERATIIPSEKQVKATLVVCNRSQTKKRRVNVRWSESATEAFDEHENTCPLVARKSSRQTHDLQTDMAIRVNLLYETPVRVPKTLKFLVDGKDLEGVNGGIPLAISLESAAIQDSKQPFGRKKGK